MGLLGIVIEVECDVLHVSSWLASFVVKAGSPFLSGILPVVGSGTFLLPSKGVCSLKLRGLLVRPVQAGVVRKGLKAGPGHIED
ncbi:hypothetical protein D9M68_733690 [compost metagenome]